MTREEAQKRENNIVIEGEMKCKNCGELSKVEINTIWENPYKKMWDKLQISADYLLENGDPSLYYTMDDIRKEL